MLYFIEEALDIFKKLLGFRTPSFYLDLIEKVEIDAFDFSLPFFTIYWRNLS